MYGVPLVVKCGVEEQVSARGQGSRIRSLRKRMRENKKRLVLVVIASTRFPVSYQRNRDTLSCTKGCLALLFSWSRS